jgi:hypothetical protein
MDHQVLGNKADAAVEAAASTASVIGYLKGIVKGASHISETGLKANHPTGLTTLFTITGSVKITDIVGIVGGTAFGAASTETKLTVTCDSLTAVDICAVVDLTGAAVGTSYHITGTLANAAVLGVNGVTIAQATPILVMPTATALIKMSNAGAANAGRMRWKVRWEPLSEDATVVAAF